MKSTVNLRITLGGKAGKLFCGLARQLDMDETELARFAVLDFITSDRMMERFDSLCNEVRELTETFEAGNDPSPWSIQKYAPYRDKILKRHQEAKP